MSVTGFIHVNVNCSNFDASLAFYERLGFVKVTDVPPENTAEVAAAVGMPPYRVKGALLALKGGKSSMLIDLLEWQRPNDSAPPYPHLYHLGIARIALASDDLDGDMAALKSVGVDFLSEPAVVHLEGQAAASRFVCFRDPDGTILELVESVAST